MVLKTIKRRYDLDQLDEQLVRLQCGQYGFFHNKFKS
ncbi:hypothetical protein Enr17x_36860 [Gimesia fumaroli]|uniref:Uncharacterized protein n=1 Tax=Gimesia fumaroli TaxID=2527976 RepID=A0A518IEV7_9PLAN|nr:hypothetical protein Enr17x_36860 [Gimesia fumaroli]